jgi:hypothetical protein
MKVRHETAERRTSGLSRREYAKRRGVSPTTIRRHVLSGLLAPALLPDDSIDATLADQILAKNLTRGAGAIPGLEAARRRKLLVEIALLTDELDALRSERVLPIVELEFLRSFYALVARNSARVVADGAMLAGKEPREAFAVLTESVYATLTTIAETQAQARDVPADPDDLASGVPIEKLDLVDLAALKADRQAARLELNRATSRGELVLIADMSDDLGDRITNYRARLLGLPSRAAPLFQSLGTADEAQATTFELVAEALAQFADDAMSATELEEILRNG